MGGKQNECLSYDYFKLLNCAFIKNDVCGHQSTQAFLTPTIIYVKKIVALHEKIGLKGVVHITGGGMPDNIPRVIPKGLGVHVKANSYEIPPLFQWLQKAGNVPLDDMRRTFNMGVGMIMVVDPSQVSEVQQIDPEIWVLGHIVEGDGVTFV